MQRKRIHRSDTPGAEARSVSDRLIKPGAGHPRTPGRTGKLGHTTPARGSMPDAGRASQPPSGGAANPRSRAWTRLACRSLPMSSVYRDKGRDSGRRAGALAPGCRHRSAPKHRNAMGQRPTSVFHRQPKTRQTQCKPKPHNQTTRPPPPSSLPLYPVIPALYTIIPE